MFNTLLYIIKQLSNVDRYLSLSFFHENVIIFCSNIFFTRHEFHVFFTSFILQTRDMFIRSLCIFFSDTFLITHNYVFVNATINIVHVRHPFIITIMQILIQNFTNLIYFKVHSLFVSMKTYLCLTFYSLITTI